MSGVVTGIVVAMMSFTGVILTYEHQMLEWSDRQYRLSPAPNESKVNVDDLVSVAESNGLSIREIVFSSDPTKPVVASEGRRGKSVYVDQYSGEVLGEPAQGMRRFVRSVTGWHRWFNASGENRASARLVTGISNLAFLFMVLTGLYLWLPKIFRWPLLRARLLFQKSYTNKKLRDFHWHHIFGIWSAIPLTIVIATAVVFSFSWANDLVFQYAGDEQSSREGPTLRAQDSEARAVASAPLQSLDELIRRAMTFDESWNTITMDVPDPGLKHVTLTVDTGTGRQPQHRTDVVLNSITGEIVDVRPFSDLSPGRRARFFIRFLHTGEVYGFVGQTVAGLVSLASLFMVWTGFALSWRRLISPLFRRRRRA